MEGGRRERKVVTVLFADLVGFTARAERLDPEDVEAILRPYHERLRSELERFGGTVEKFIGDAVMALFGAPVAHEDDPERAVRAALAIRDWAREREGVQVRIAVNTGEALINLDARPQSGEGMAAGDVVNTSARLQAAAPVNGVLVGEQTYHATNERITFRESPPVEAKGKARPVRVWEALEPRARVGSEAVSAHVPLVGRRRELDQLVDAFERARQERSTQLVTIVGIPGIGKSRLVAELLGHVESVPELVYWRHGRSLPYGEGVAFWALSEMLKAHAGMVENDAPETVERKLTETIADAVVDASDRRWVESKLRPLLGLGGDDVAGEREDSFAAWRRFFESLAEQRPLVLVFEDLHWAGDELLDFVDELPEWIEDVPLLVLCTARPELLDHRSGWGGGKRNALTISLAPLGTDDTAKLVAALLDRAVLPAETQETLLARAGGNPLYAEQFVHMLVERGDVGEGVPENVQGIIAARLDLLPTEEKQLLQDAAVVGKVFWAGALAGMVGSDPVSVERGLRSLARKEFVRRERRVSIEGESEYVFNHILVRDVAYGQIPRSERAEKHRRTADWMESLGRAEDQAELLAHHYTSALELLQASGVDAGDLPARARATLRAAGARALSLYAYASAARSFEAAEALSAGPDPERPRALLQHALALHALLDPSRFELFDEAIAALTESGDADGAVEGTVALVEAWWWAGDRDRCSACLERAAGFVREDVTPQTRAIVLSQLARFRQLFGDNDQAIETALEGLRLAESLNRDDLRAKNLVTLATARFFAPGSDLAEVVAAMHTAIEAARTCGDATQLSRAFINLSVFEQASGNLPEAEKATQEALRLAQLRGNAASKRFSESNLIDSAFTVGRWEEAELRATSFLEESQRGSHYGDALALTTRSAIAFARDDRDRALADIERAVEIARRIKDPQAFIPVVAAEAMIRAELGERDAAVALIEEIEAGPFISTVPMAFFAAAQAGCAEGFRRRTAAFDRDTPWDEAAGAVLDARWADAAVVFEEMGARPFAALAGLRAAAALAADARRAEANDQLQRALAFWRCVGARRYVREGEALLAASA